MNKEVAIAILRHICDIDKDTDEIKIKIAEIQTKMSSASAHYLDIMRLIKKEFDEIA